MNDNFSTSPKMLASELIDSLEALDRCLTTIHKEMLSASALLDIISQSIPDCAKHSTLTDLNSIEKLDDAVFLLAESSSIAIERIGHMSGLAFTTLKRAKRLVETGESI